MVGPLALRLLLSRSRLLVVMPNQVPLKDLRVEPLLLLKARVHSILLQTKSLVIHVAWEKTVLKVIFLQPSFVPLFTMTLLSLKKSQ
jgi:hypothetical protein